MKSFFHVFVTSDDQKIILTAQKHQESIRNGIVDLSERHHDHKKRQTADFQKSQVLGGGKNENSQFIEMIFES